MKTPDQNIATGLLAIEFEKIPMGYKLTNQFTQSNEPNEKIEILEATPLNTGRFFLLAQGDLCALKKIDQSLDNDKGAEVFQKAIFESVHPTLLATFFNLSAEKLQQGLLLFETKSNVLTLALANEVLLSGSIKPIEIRSSRGLGEKSIAIFTGSTEELSEAHEKLKKHASFKQVLSLEIIDNLSAQFRSFFSIEP